MWQKIERTATIEGASNTAGSSSFLEKTSVKAVFILAGRQKITNIPIFIHTSKTCFDLKKIMINLAKHYDKKQKPSFHKMKDGTPNFHRIIDKKITKKYIRLNFEIKY